MSIVADDPLASVLGDPEFSAVTARVIAATGLSYYAGRDIEMAQQVQARLAELRLDSCSAYVALLESGSAGQLELDTLIDCLTIGETYFFRHREMFDALETTVLPQLIERNRPRRKLRVWSAGCSVGAEAYSVAIVLKRAFGDLLRDWEITILGTDINRDFLAQARRGRFDQWMFRSAPSWLKQQYFTPVDGGWQIAPTLRRSVSFEYHNLARHRFPSLFHNLYAFDLIFCRNVMIYGNPAFNRRIADGCWESLVDGGWLMVGHAEADADLFRRFRSIHAPGATLYRKEAGVEHPVRGRVTRAAATVYVDQRSGRANGANRQPQSRKHGPDPHPPQSRPTAQGRARSHPAAQPRAANPIEAGLDEVRRLTDLGDLQAAAVCCRDVLRVDRLNPVATFFLALIAQQLGNYEEARRGLRETIYLDRDCVLAHYYLALVELQQNQRRPAHRSLRNVLKLLAGRPGDELLPPADDLSVADLANLASIHLERPAGT